MTRAAVYPVDCHVHLHPGFGLPQVLDAALRNMSAASSGAAMLMLTESAGVDAFGALPDAAGPWAISATAEPMTRVATGPQGALIAIVSGRQIVSAEGLEVHALGMRETFADGAPIRDIIAAASEVGALVVLPWGFGKWSGTRGRLIAELIENAPSGLMLSDSGVRPALISRPDLLAQAEGLGLKVLAGTDPLPLAGDATKPGRFGFVATHAFDADRPFAALQTWLTEIGTSPETFGNLESPARFLYAQIAMQIRKRIG